MCLRNLAYKIAVIIVFIERVCMYFLFDLLIIYEVGLSYYTIFRTSVSRSLYLHSCSVSLPIPLSVLLIISILLSLESNEWV